MGATGTGKSTFIKLLTNDDNILVGHKQQSETFGAQAAHYTDQATGRPIVLIDTPGFDDSREGITDTDILEKIVQFLEPTNGEGIKLNGVVYMHRISDPRVGGASRKNLRLFRSLCGDKNLGNVRIVTTNWSRVSEEEGDRREADLKSNAFKALLDCGAQMRRHANTVESARKIMSELVPLPAMTMQIQEELREGKKLSETAAGKVVMEEMADAQKKHERELADLKKEMEVAAEAKDHALRLELEEERQVLEDRMARANADRKRLDIALMGSERGRSEKSSPLHECMLDSNVVKLPPAQTLRLGPMTEIRGGDIVRHDSENPVRLVGEGNQVNTTARGGTTTFRVDALTEELGREREARHRQMEQDKRMREYQEAVIRREERELLRVKKAELDALKFRKAAEERNSCRIC
ncbi:P-loop containing nucleoside triphosphate hydrolase protein [Chiua virens]|nr:P-loop containing nucleoside triphosphate hydrolase protein [Chiua virens]